MRKLFIDILEIILMNKLFFNLIKMYMMEFLMIIVH